MKAAYNPWRALASHIWVEEQVLPPGERARLYPALGIIQIAKGLTQAARRVAICHELIHLENGDNETGIPKSELLQEQRTDQATAHRLIDIVALGDALCAASDNDWQGVAQELWVDEPTLRTRLEHLHPSERAYLRRRLAARDHTEGEQ